MLTRDEYEILFASWMNQYGVTKTSQRGVEFVGVPDHPNERQEMLGYLINTLVTEHGYQESDFGQFTKNLIVEQCVNPEYADKKRLASWRAAVYRDINTVLGKVFVKEFVKLEPTTQAPRKQEKRLQEAIQKTDELPDSYFNQDPTPYDEEEITITKPLDDSIFKGIPDITYPRLTHEEFVAKLEKEIADREREENGDE